MKRKRAKSYRTESEREFYQDQAETRVRHAESRCEAAWHPACPEHRPYDGATYVTHHVHTRAKGGSDDWENLRFVCVPCHHLIHARPNEARSRGLLR